MTVNDIGLHKSFKLHGIAYTSSKLKDLGYDLVKEGSSFERAMGDFFLNWLDESLTIAVTTSGSTGIPKSILLQKQQMVNSALATGKYFDLKEEDTALLCLPAEYIAGKMMLVRAMVLGLELDYVEPASNPLTAVSKSYDFAAMVPLQVENAVAKIEQIKTLLIGGAAVSIKLKEKLREKRTVVFETYGMTETITHVAARKINPSMLLSSQGDTNNFTALPDVLFSTDDRACLVIAAAKVSDHSIVTNDVVHLISKTEFEWLGRYDNVINSGGVKLFPEQIETKLVPILNRRFFIAGVPDEKLGQKVVLVVEGAIDSEKLMQSIGEEECLERFEIPKNVYVIPKFVETETGKIRRTENLRLSKK